MKNYFKTAFIALLLAGTFSACSEDDDTTLPNTAYAMYSEDYGTVNIVNNSPVFSFNLADEGWTTFAEAGSKNWFVNFFGTNVYLEFSSFNSGNSSNIGWIISPAINIDQAKLKRMIFQSAMHHATSLDNKFEMYVSTDFDGTNVLGATWEKKAFRLPPYLGYGGKNYEFVNSGAVDLSKYSGNIYVAFKVTGNTSAQAGGFQIDNIKVF